MSARGCLNWPICPTCERPRDMEPIQSDERFLRCPECQACWARVVCESYDEIERLRLNCALSDDETVELEIDRLLEGARVQ